MSYANYDDNDNATKSRSSYYLDMLSTTATTNKHKMCLKYNDIDRVILGQRVKFTT